MSKRILIVEDELDIIELISFHLKKEGFEIDFVTEGDQALPAIEEQRPDLILLDLMLPGMDGFDVCRQLKGIPEHKNIPIIMVSAKSEEPDIVSGLELGAEDYVTKPFSPKILISRVKAVLRRANKPVDEPQIKEINTGDLTISKETQECHIKGEEVKLTFSEFETLFLLVSNPNRVYTRYQIVEEVHGHDYAVTDRSIDVMMVSLRKKIGDFATNIETIRGVGYRFKDKP